jgi:RNA polymerase sigma-70 factor (ECF subfamily)
MTIPPREPLTQLSETVKDSWHRFLDIYEPLRPDVYRYCRYLTRSPWDADDLAQDAMAKAFVTLGCMAGAPANPRAWLFRVASNLWIDRVRRRREEPVARTDLARHGAAASASEPQASREAAGTLLAALSPQERAALVLKDVFDLTLAEVAEALSTTEGAIKTALHRARGKLAEPEAPEAQESKLPRQAALDEFCEAFKAQDLDRLTALLLDTTSVEVVGVHTEYGGSAAREGVFQGMLFGARLLAEGKGIDPEYKQGALPAVPRPELRFHRGEWLVLLWYAHEDGEAVRGFARIEVAADKISAIRNYFYTPDVIEEVCRELGVPSRLNGYRYWAFPPT